MGTAFPIECITYLSTGTGISGIIPNFIRALCLLYFGTQNAEAITKGTLVYFTISGLIVFSTVFVHYKFSNCKFYKFYMNKAINSYIITKETKDLLVD